MTSKLKLLLTLLFLVIIVYSISNVALLKGVKSNNDRYTYINYQFSSYVYKSYLIQLSAIFKNGDFDYESIKKNEVTINEWRMSLDNIIQKRRMITPTVDSETEKKKAIEFWRVNMAQVTNKNGKHIVDLYYEVSA